jgi:capsular exopolysaccharide synthesis family protein
MSNEPNLDSLDAKPRLKLDPTQAGQGQAGGGYGDAYLVDEPHLLDYVKVLYKRRWTAITAFLVVFLSVVVYTFTATPIYEARAKLLIEADNPNIVSFKEVLEEGQSRTDYYQTQYNLLQSRSLARRTLDTLKLWNHPQFGGKSEKEGFSLRGAISGAVSYVGRVFRPAKEQPPAPDETVAQSQAMDALLGNLRISPVRNSRIVEVTFRSPDPALATNVANAHAKGYIEQNMEFKFLTSKEATDWLSARMAEARTQVEDAETALQKYREQNEAISLEDRENIVVQKLADLNAAVTRAKTERIEKEALYSQLAGIQNNQAALDTFPAILANTFIQQQKAELATLQRQQAEMAEKLGDRHPEMIKIRATVQTAQAKLQGEIGKVVQSVRNEFLSAQAQERSLTSALDAQKRDALAMNRKAIEYGVLRREAESARQIYDSLLQRAKETGVSSELRASNIRIVDNAERPRAPVTPRKGLNLLLALFGGGILAAGLAFFFEYLDNRIKTPDEIKAHLALPFLGLIPTIPDKERQGAAPLLNNGVPASFAEALRTVRTNLLFSSAEEGMRSLAVTSTGPGEGKTVVSSNLALALAQAGQRVLLIDGDMRRPQLHDRFAQKAEPGLSNLMVGNAKASEAVRKTSASGLWLLPAGKVPPNPAELLGSKRFKDFLGTLADHFDWIVIDTPPVLPVADASVVAHAVTGVLFVIGAEMTSRHAAGAALDQLSGTRARFVGAVLNRVDLQHHAYYYSQYYRREYSRYYGKSS